jgi:hypothetical protein
VASFRAALQRSLYIKQNGKLSEQVNHAAKKPDCD